MKVFLWMQAMDADFQTDRPTQCNGNLRLNSHRDYDRIDQSLPVTARRTARHSICDASFSPRIRHADQRYTTSRRPGIHSHD
jgi:hypothetical protein